MQEMEPMKMYYFSQDENFPFFIQMGDQQGDFNMHRHEDFFEMVVVTDGTAMHIVENESYPISMGDVFIISGNTSHGFKDAVDFKPCNIMFDPDIFFACAQDLMKTPGFQALFVVEPNLSKTGGFKARLKLSLDDYRRISTITTDMLSEQEKKPSGWQTKFKADFLLLCTMLSRAYEARNKHKENGLYSIAESLAYIEKSYLTDISVSELAKISNYSERQFLRLFRKTSGCTPTEYIRRLRIRNACRLLTSSPGSITEISSQCGYSDSNYFTRAFKAETGMTPRQFRASFLNSPTPFSVVADY